ncbi:MAG: hypothetical protein CMM01_04140 [Rhodopirellula sp.]|nr:hypothetical protein [Rhodopirellula sp.]
MLRRITYTSLASVTLDQRALLDLLHAARGYNKLDQITGVLIHDQGRFLQVIEGPISAIENLVQRLQSDRRHWQLKIHEDVFAETRLFSDWAMGLGELTDPTLACLPGFLNESDEQNRLFELVERLPELSTP